MKYLFKNLWRHKGAVLIIMLLLLLQAFCELALPGYTADIVDVGIEQYGVDGPAMTRMRAETYEQIRQRLSAEDAALFSACYQRAKEGTYELADISKETKEALGNIMAEPLVELYAMHHEAAQESDVSRILGEDSDSLKAQTAVLFVQQEYEAMGISMAEHQHAYLMAFGGRMLFVTILMALFAVFIGLLSSRTGAAIGRDLREEIYRHVISFSGREIDRFSTASLITRCTNDVQQVQMVCVMFLRMVLYAPVLAAGGIIQVANTRTGMSWLIVVAVVLLLFLVCILMRWTLPKFKIMQQLIDRMNLVSREILTGVSVIRAFSREEHETARFEEANRNLMDTQLYTSRMMALMMPLMMFIMNGITIAIVWFGSKGVDAGNLQVGDMMAFITYTMMIIMSFLMITVISIMLPRAGVAAARIQEVIDTSISIRDPGQPRDDTLGTVRGEIAFRDVSFRYPNAKADVLEHLSFTAKPGKVTAIIGSTGCGKSTLLNLIPRLYDVTEGSITLDGVDIREISQKKLRDCIGYVPQKAVLFSGNIASNIKYADERITDERMRESADIAQAKEFVEGKAKKYESAIAQGGMNVSGGQKQRLSIARAIAKNPQIYLFDDSFSALDYKTDRMLRKNLFEKTKEATIIIVAQRISTILHADQIIVLDEGKIAGIGKHGELLQHCEAYREIAFSQLSEEELNHTKGGGAA